MGWKKKRFVGEQDCRLLKGEGCKENINFRNRKKGMTTTVEYLSTRTVYKSHQKTTVVSEKEP